VRAVLRSPHLGELRRLQFGGGLDAERMGVIRTELADPRHLPRLTVLGGPEGGASVAGYRRAE
jgi:hypothetical protein